MNELDTVKAARDLTNDIKKNTVGVIVHKYDFHNFEVEFFDKNQNTIDVLTCKDNDLILVHKN